MRDGPDVARITLLWLGLWLSFLKQTNKHYLYILLDCKEIKPINHKGNQP